MMRHWKSKALIALAAGAFAVAPLLSQTAPKPTTPNPSTPAPTNANVAAAPAQVSPEAATVVKHVSDAYTKLTSLDLSGKVSGDFDVAGQQDKQDANFTSTFAAPNLFRQEIQDQAMGSTGKQLYVYARGRNVYLSVDAPKGKVTSDELPQPFGEMIGAQNISLALAMSKDPAGELTRSYGKISRGADVKEGETSYTVLSCTNSTQGQPDTTLLIDPRTNLVHKATLDMSPTLKAQGAPDVKKALVTIDYTTSTPGAAAKPEQFAWTPPAGAKDAKELQASGADVDDPAGAIAALEGKPAPAFSLKTLDGKEISLASLKGKVVVLDFWATWCPPCIASLPDLDKLYRENLKDVVVLAVNRQEETGVVEKFWKAQNFAVPTLLDPDGKAVGPYKADAIPEKVVIDKGGIVRKVLIGIPAGTEEKLRAAITAAQKAQ